MGHAFATVGETDPTGDERAFALSRKARLILIYRHAEYFVVGLAPSVICCLPCCCGDR